MRFSELYKTLINHSTLSTGFILLLPVDRHPQVWWPLLSELRFSNLPGPPPQLRLALLLGIPSGVTPKVRDPSKQARIEELFSRE